MKLFEKSAMETLVDATGYQQKVLQHLMEPEVSANQRAGISLSWKRRNYGTLLSTMQ